MATWVSGPNGLAMLNLGDMVPGEVITVIYDYVIVAADLPRVTFVNTATAHGNTKESPDDPVQVSSDSTATIEIAEADDVVVTGERDYTMFGWGLILMGAALVLTIQRRRYAKVKE